MPKRKIKEEKPRKRMGKKEVLVVPIIMGGATLVAFLVGQLAPPPDPTTVCLKNHEIETFQLYPKIEFIVDGQQVLMPDGVGKEPKDGQDCMRPMHTDSVGNDMHVEYLRPIRFTMADFMKIYAFDGKTITVINNSTGTNVEQVLTLADYDIQYSYFSENQEFTKVPEAKDVPPFTKEMVVRAELTSK